MKATAYTEGLTYSTIWDLLNEHGTTTPSGFAKEAYRRTPCGVSTTFLVPDDCDDSDEAIEADPDAIVGVVFGAIVEGSDAEFSTDPLRFPFTDKDLAEAWDYLEEMTDDARSEANGIHPELLQTYQEFRRASPFMLVGRHAEMALHAARTLIRFRQLEATGHVRLRVEPEEESYFDAMGVPDDEREAQRMEKILNDSGCWFTCTEFRLDVDKDEWEHADSCGMHVGYADPGDPFENCYVIGEMSEALDKLDATLEKEDREACEEPARSPSSST